MIINAIALWRVPKQRNSREENARMKAGSCADQAGTTSQIGA